MKRRISILKHMLEDITDINDFTKGVEFDTFVSKNILKKSVCMLLINIGELAKALQKSSDLRIMKSPGRISPD